jgi:hypothetical protein
MAKKSSTHQTKTHWLLCPQNTSSAIKKIIGSLLYYAQAVNNKLLVALNAISARQAKVTVHREQLIEMLLNYVATYPNDSIFYRARDMVLCMHADAGYLNKTQSCSRAGAHIFVLEDNPSPHFNGTVLTIWCGARLSDSKICKK